MIERTPIAIYQGEVNPYNEVDYLDEARKLVTTQFENKDIFDRYVRLLLNSRPELQQVLKQLIQDRSLFNAVGEQLDIIGNIVGQPRTLFDSAIIYYFGFNGAAGASGYGTVNEEESVGFWKSVNDPLLGVRSLNDEEYRTLIKIKIIKNTSKADITSFIDAVRLLFGTEAITYIEDGASITVGISRDYNNQNESIFPGLDETVLASRFLNTPIGVELFLIPSQSLVLDFLTQSYRIYEQGFVNLQPKTFNQLLTFTRASGGTYFDDLGVLQTAANDVPRFDYDPISGEPLGLLVEGQITNLILRSESVSVSPWVQDGVTVTDNADIAPDGQTTADAIYDTTVNALHRIEQDISGSAVVGQNYVWSVFLKKGSLNFAILNAQADIALPNVSTVFDLENGEVVSQGSDAIGSGIVPLKNGWYRCYIIFQAQNPSGGLDVRLTDSGLNSTGTYLGDGNGFIYVWGAQLEKNSSLTSYTPSGSSQSTRSADDCQRLLGSEWQPSAFTIYVETSAAIPKSSGENQSAVFAALTSDLNNFIQVAIDDSNTVQLGARANGVTNLNAFITVPELQTTNKFALAFDGVTTYLYVNGVSALVSTSISAQVYLNVDTLRIGSFATNPQEANGPVKEQIIYPYAMPQNEVIALTS